MRNIPVAVFALLLSACLPSQSYNTFKPHAYANVRTWDVGFMFENAPIVTETRKDDTTGKDVKVTKQEGQPNWALSVREDVYYAMLGRAGFRMAPKGTKADATVMLSFDSTYLNGNIGIINLTVLDRNGEPLSRLKYENRYPSMSLEYRERMVTEIVALLAEEVNANK